MRHPPKPTYEQLEAELFAMRQERAARLADAQRVIDWIDNPARQPAVHAFTEGNERQIAYRFEHLLRGEFICRKCGLRKDGEPSPATF